MKFVSNRKQLLGETRWCRPVVFMVFLLCTLSAVGQQITATLTGTVADDQGALVVNAVVKAQNVDTKATRSVSVNQMGQYTLQYLPVGSYTVEVSAPNFKKFVQQNVVLTVDQTRSFNVTLSVGESTETITVSSAPPVINLTTSEQGRTVEPDEILGLPLVNRNAYAEVSLTPGVQSNSAGNSSTAGASGSPNFVVGVPSTQIQINGGIDGNGSPTVSYYLDGGLNMTGIRNYGNPLPNPDALQEFRVETSNYAAQYGRMSGAVITAVTRSGTNQFHGSAFEFVRNTAFNATPWNSTVKPPYHRNQFGGTVGGPVVHDKAFFFFSYGGLRQSIGTLLTGGELPTALERLGDFTQLPAGEATPNVIGTNSSPNCSTPKLGCIPTASLDPTAANLMSKYIPLPNSPGNLYTGYFAGPTTSNEYLGKYDQQIGDHDHIAASYFYLNIQLGAFGSGNFPYSVNESYSRQQVANLSEIHNFTGNTTNQAWLNFTRVQGGRVNLPAVGIEDLGSSYTTQGPKSLPSLSVSGYFSAGGALAGPQSVTDFYDFRDLVSTNKGKHSISMGGEVSLEKDLIAANLNNFGVFSFVKTTPGGTGNALADFVAGKVGSMEQDTPYQALINTWNYSFFLQDNYHVSPRLTLNLGVRYDLSPSPTETRDQLLTFVPNVRSTIVPTAPLGVLFPGDAGVPRGIVALRAHHVSPRVGLAWDVFGDGKTAFHAAAGVFYGSPSANEWGQPSNSNPFTVQQTYSSITSLTDIYSNPVSFPNGNPFPYTFSPSNPTFLPAAHVIATSKDFQWPLVYQISSSVEQQLPGQMTLNMAYVGTLMHDLPNGIDANYPAYAPGATTSQASINARRPYDPGVLGQMQVLTSTQTASYHALQVSAHRRMTQHLMLNGFYVFSHTFSSFSAAGIGLTAPQDYNYMKLERGPADYDRTSTSAISGIWDVSYYRGSNRVLSGLLNGWTLTPIVTMNSGAPLNILTGSDNNADSYNTDRPNLVPGVNAFLSPHRNRQEAAAAWFNKAAFTANGPGLGIGTGGASGTTPRNYLRSPGFKDIDLGLFRDIKFDRGIKLQFRCEANNAFNLVSLNAPTATVTSSSNGRITSAAPNRTIQLGARLSF